MRRKRRAFGSVKRRTDKPGVYAVFHWQGRRFERSAPDAKTAEQNLAAAHALLAQRIPLDTVLSEVFGDSNGVRMTFRDAVEPFMSYRATRKKASTLDGDHKRFNVILKAPWAGKLLRDVRTVDVQRWADTRCSEDGASGATVNRDLALTSALFKWAIRCEHADSNPLKRVERFSEKGRAREVYLTAEECRALVDVAAPALRPVLLCALSTGMRRGELLSLAWGDVDFARRELVVRAENEKAGRGRVVRMTEDLYHELTTLRASTRVLALDGTSHVFASEDGAPLTDKALRSMFDSAVRRCDAIPLSKRGSITFHTLRHTAASLMVQAGASLYEVAEVLGHSTLATTRRYAHLGPEAGRSPIERLGKALSFGSDASIPRVAGGAE